MPIAATAVGQRSHRRRAANLPRKRFIHPTFAGMRAPPSAPLDSRKSLFHLSPTSQCAPQYPARSRKRRTQPRGVLYTTAAVPDPTGPDPHISVTLLTPLVVDLDREYVRPCVPGVGSLATRRTLTLLALVIALGPACGARTAAVFMAEQAKLTARTFARPTRAWPRL